MASITQLQKPEYVYFGGKICRWEDANFHISSEAVLRGLNVFEGLKGYWQPDGSFGIVAMRRHYDRLRRSAKILHIPFEMSYEEFEQAHHDLIKLLYQRDRNMWVRATLYGDEGFWGEGSTSNLVLTAYHTPTTRPASIDLGVTPWKRGTDLAMPCRVKTSTNYQIARFVKIEGRDRGYSDMIILNEAGRVAETTQTCVLMVRDGKVFTPPAWEGALESITVDIVESLCRSMGIPFERRPIERTELIIADEVALVGTLAEITPVKSIEKTEYGENPIITAITERYCNAVSGIDPHPAVDFSVIPAQTESLLASAQLTGVA
ncbi:aminotransferase class IV [Pseudanabaenaceae cyanobacterium LEGE 13415]|nr:aminotransferase class IV [Pseudanabaenaceae cyanobacterium LEGE 13415]